MLPFFVFLGNTTVQVFKSSTLEIIIEIDIITFNGS